MHREFLRPRVHFTPNANWMNDPNGLVFHDEEYHLFYQHNPTGKGWDHMSWGHAVSTDLVHWEHLPVAMPHDQDRSIMRFSGSCVIDYENDAGLGTDTMLAFYTGHHHAEEPHRQDVRMAYSADNGRTFTQFDGNPVVDTQAEKFGDPKVFWYSPTEQWIMASISGSPRGCVEFYGSTDLLQWKHLSTFADEKAIPGMWECPDLFPMHVDGNLDDLRWVMLINTGGHGQHWSSYYITGQFDGTTFVSDTPGESFDRRCAGLYAEVTFENEPNDCRLLMGWIRQSPAEHRPWTGVQSVLHDLTLRNTEQGVRLFCRPIEELQERSQPVDETRDIILSDTPFSLPDPGDGALDIDAHLELSDDAHLIFETGPTDADKAQIRWQDNRLYLEPPGPKDSLTHHDAPLLARDGMVAIRLLFDRSVLEIFGNDGEQTMALSWEHAQGAAGENLTVRIAQGQASIKHLSTYRYD